MIKFKYENIKLKEEEECDAGLETHETLSLNEDAVNCT
jgi:hypothetical protein